MTQVTTTATAMDFNPLHKQRVICGRGDRPFDRCKKTWPPSPTIKLSVRGKQWQITTSAVIRALAIFLIEFTGKWALSAMFA